MRTVATVAVLLMFVAGGASAADSAKKAKKPSSGAAATTAKKKAPSAKATAEPEANVPPGENPLAGSFTEFCKEWMLKLNERETRNKGMIQWESGLNWVQGTYTGFAPEYTCIVDGVGANTIGKMTYREVKFEKRGATVDDAQSRPPHALEVTEVTEIFRFEKGAWVW